MSRSIAATRGRRTARFAIGTLPFLVVPLLVLGSVWLPLVAHYRAPETSITPPMVEAARTLPGDGVLEELRTFYLLRIANRSPSLEVAAAEAILQGRLELPNLPVGQLRVPLTPEDLGRLPGGLQLSFAGLVVPDLLLAAFVETGREEFFVAAKAFIESWDRYERGSWGPGGLLWNDHAIAARVRVLAEFWRVYRTRPDYDPEVGRAVLAQADRYGFFLSDAGQFTFATNHGIMQNLGLLMLSLSFPTLPDRARYRDLAVERLGGQLAFLLDDSGVFRENSAGYQAFDLGLLGMTYRCLTLLGDPIPPAWARGYDAALAVLAALRRPDDTLPAVGDTDGASQGDFPPTTVIDAAGQAAPLVPYVDRRPEDPEVLAAAAGYWIDWTGLEGWPGGNDLGQTVMTWTSPPGPGHKHADELSLEVWADGVVWLTGVGYWPYDDPGRIQAESWTGANAPHLAGEASTSVRTTALLSHGRSDAIGALDVERVGPGAYQVRRQVVHVGPDLWIVLDTTSGGASESVWTLSPELELRPADTDGSFVIEATTGTDSGRVDFVGSAGTTFTTYRGSAEPFAGWQVVNGAPRPAPAVVVRQPIEPGWLATVVTRTGGPAVDQASYALVDARIVSAENWSVTHAADGAKIEVRRTGATVTVAREDATGTSTETVQLGQGPDVEPDKARIRAAFNDMASVYPQFQPLVSRRTIATMVILALTLVQETGLLVLRRRWPATYVPLRALGTVGWLAFAAWLSLFIVRSWEVLRLPA